MDKIKQAQLVFKVSSIICVIVAIIGFYKINHVDIEQRKLSNMPMNDFKVMAQKDLSENKDISVIEYKVIVNPEISSDNLKNISEDIVYQAKENRKINGVQILMYGSQKDIQEGIEIAQIVYAPYGKLDNAIQGMSVSEGQYKYQIKAINKSFK